MSRSLPTMKDVAREAGVALGTVSRVFNGQTVGEDYRKKVEEAAQRLGYQVNPYARAMKTNKTNVVAVILPENINPHFTALVQQLNAALTRRNYRMMLFLTDSHHEREDECIRMVRQNKVDGIIGLTYSMVEVHEDIPFVSIDRYFGPNVPCVAADNYGGGRMAAEKLAALGCKRLAFFHRGSNIPGEVDKRRDGFANGCSLMRIPCDIVSVFNDANSEIFREYFQAHIRDGKPDFDGIFCSTDYLATQICFLAKEFGLRVPEDIQIIGFDGVRRFDTGEYYCSTIIQPADKIAETCVEILLRPDRENIPALTCLPVSYGKSWTTRE